MTIMQSLHWKFPVLFNIHTTKFLFFYDSFYIVRIYTPGVERKEQVQIEVSYDDRSITITAESSIIGFNDCTIIENNIQIRFRIDIIFLKM